MLAVMQGPDRADPTTLGVAARCPMADLHRGIQGLRLARIKTEHMPHLTRGGRGSLRLGIGPGLREAGATITDVELPLPLDTYQHLGGIISATEAYATYSDIVDNPNSHMAAPNRTRMARGAKITAAELIRIQRDRSRRSPTSRASSIAPMRSSCRRQPSPPLPLQTLTRPICACRATLGLATTLSLAALAVPMSLTPAGFPTSLQIVVRRFDDPLALAHRRGV